ncbi:YfaP family protein [Vibrio splendidus]|uniref:YfaP family protein n=1 Tax=Vibrio splendidus TaxID=29497 RepID=UPI001E598CDF|nr:hypothetical protein [Vibrio splendidus]MCC4791182.1 hypothetical protein [Vibrio splendidus]
MKKIIITALAASISFNVSSATVCEVPGYVVGFFNGVWNTKNEAKLATFEFQKQIGNEYNSEPVAYETFYNVTGSSVSASAFQDIAEVFIQRAEEIDPDLGGRFDIFWSAITGGGADGFLDKVYNIVSAPSDLVLGLLTELYDWASSQTVALVSQLFSSPPTASDYARHNTRIQTLGTQGAKMLFIAHSQGNLFANNAYNAALELDNLDESNLGVVHIAPASPQLNGPYTLADLDLVINGLRAVGTVPDTNVSIPVSHLEVDPSGHTLIQTYLNTYLQPAGMIRNDLQSELASLQTPEAIASTGSFTATLSWNGLGDVDLHTFEPNGMQVYYQNRVGNVGELDVDNTSGYGPEHYFATCDRDNLELGVYSIGVNNYARAEGRIATVQISTGSISDVLTKSVTLGEAQGSSENANPLHMMNVVVSENDSGGIEIGAF